MASRERRLAKSGRVNRLSLKLTAAFIVVAICAVGLVSYWANRATTDEFSSYVRSSSQVPPAMLRNALARGFLDSGDWSRLQPSLQRLAELSGARLIISDDRGRVIADSDGQMVGRTLGDGEQALAVPLIADGQTVGFVHYLDSDAGRTGQPLNHGGMMGGMMGSMMGGSPTQHMGDLLDAAQRDFLSQVNNSLWIAGAIAAILAAALGLLLVRQITLPLRSLTEAAARVASGDLSHRVPVRSRDELGVLALTFNAMADSLAQNEQIRQQMVADIAHELRTPLSVIQGNLEGMRDGIIEPTAERLASVHEESLLLARLISDLRELSLAEAGQLPLQLVETDLVEVACRAVDRVEQQAVSSGVSITANMPPMIPLVQADPDRIGQVLHNLLVNALRHTPPNGQIVVSVGLGAVHEGGQLVKDSSKPVHIPEWVIMSVADTGAGIPNDDLPRIFDRFYRVDKSRARTSGGSGIGLAIVKQLVEAHGGRVWATSSVGNGSVFSFALPAILDITDDRLKVDSQPMGS